MKTFLRQNIINIFFFYQKRKQQTKKLENTKFGDKPNSQSKVSMATSNFIFITINCR